MVAGRGSHDVIVTMFTHSVTHYGNGLHCCLLCGAVAAEQAAAPPSARPPSAGDGVADGASHEGVVQVGGGHRQLVRQLSAPV